jgi:Trp operon repressor
MPDIPDHDTTMIVVLVARGSAAENEQGLHTRLLHLRDLCATQGWLVCREYVEKTLAADFTIKIISKKMGRPRVTDRQDFKTRYNTILERLRAGDVSRRRAAKELGIGYATLKRLLDHGFTNSSPQIRRACRYKEKKEDITSL